MPNDRQTVLVVDDDPIVLAVAEERLSSLGYDVTTRDQVLGTSQWIVQNQPWLVLLDIMMPAMSGTELASFLRRRGIETHIVLHSSKDSAEMQRLVRSTGALGAIPKGLDDSQFEKQFKNLTRSAESPGRILVDTRVESMESTGALRGFKTVLSQKEPSRTYCADPFFRITGQ